MYLVSSSDSAEVLSLAGGLDDIGVFNYLDLRGINTLVLMELEPDSMSWVEGEPLMFDESSGIVITRYSCESLVWFKENIDTITQYGVDSEAVSGFCDSKINQLFCVDTF